MNSVMNQPTCILRISEISVLLTSYDKGCERWDSWIYSVDPTRSDYSTQRMGQVDLQCGSY